MEERGEGAGRVDLQQVSEIKLSKVNVERALDKGEAQELPQEASRLRAESRETDQGRLLWGRPSRFRRVPVSQIHSANILSIMNFYEHCLYQTIF